MILESNKRMCTSIEIVLDPLIKYNMQSLNVSTVNETCEDKSNEENPNEQKIKIFNQ